MKKGIMICGSKADSYPDFKDNIDDTCDKCGTEIVYRPYLKEYEYHVCVTCGFTGVALAELEGKKKEIEIDPRSFKEIMDIKLKKGYQRK